MHAELFRGDADGPDLLIDTADDGTPLVDCRGWSCDNCGTLYAVRDEAEVCCMQPDAVVIASPADPEQDIAHVHPLPLAPLRDSSRPG